jgi:hypothetical protein
MNKRARDLVEKQENFENPQKKFKDNKPVQKSNVSFNISDHENSKPTITKEFLKSKIYEKVATFRSKKDIIIGKPHMLVSLSV